MQIKNGETYAQLATSTKPTSLVRKSYELTLTIKKARIKVESESSSTSRAPNFRRGGYISIRTGRLAITLILWHIQACPNCCLAQIAK